MKKTFFAILVCTISCLLANAQIVDTARFNLEYNPQLLNFKKINQAAEIIDTQKTTVKFDYYITPERLDVSFEPSAIKPLKVKAEAKPTLYRNFLKVGFGYPITPLAELCLHNGYSTKYSYGLNVHHYSQWAKPIGKTMKQLAYAPMSDTKATAFFSRFFKKQTLYSSIDYNHQYARYYGFEVDSVPEYFLGDEYKDSLQHQFHHVRAEVGVRSNYGLDEKHLKQDVRLNYDGIFANFKDMENHIGLKSFFAYDANWLKISGSQLYRLNFDVDYYRNSWNRGSDAATNGNSYVITPEVFAKWTFGEYHVLVGVGMAFSQAGLADTLNEPEARDFKFTIYPLAEFNLGIVPNILSLDVGLNGNVKYNSYESLLYENPFVKPHLENLRFTRNWINIYGGLKGNLVKKLNYNIFAKYSYASDMLFFITDTTSVLRNQFDVVYYDGGNFNVGLNMNWEVLHNLTLHFGADYWLYFVDDDFKAKYGHALYKPSLEFAFSGDYTYKDFLKFNLNFDLGFGSYEWVQNPETLSYETKMMKPILDFGLGVEWYITKQLSAFLNVNNIACQHYARYYQYKNAGINALVGVTYAFGTQKIRKK